MGEYLIKDESYRKSPLFKKFSSLHFASIGCILKKKGATSESVEQFEVTSCFERQNTFLLFCEFLINDASYRTIPLFKKCSSLTFASIGCSLRKIGATSERVE